MYAILYEGFLIALLSFFLTKLLSIIYNGKVRVSITFLVLFASIFLHELAHKMFAAKFSYLSIIDFDAYYLLITTVFLFFTGALVPPPIFTQPFAKLTEDGAMYYYLHTISVENAKETATIAIAGPIMNLILAIVSFIILRYQLYDTEEERMLFRILRDTNILLFIINILPLPGTDGSLLFSALQKIIMV